jgi:hypothetical protein
MTMAAGDAVVGVVRVVVVASACWPAAHATAHAQADPCARDPVPALLDAAREDLGRLDDDSAAVSLTADAGPPGGCPELDVARLAVSGWAEARRLALVGGAPEALGSIRQILERLAFVVSERPATTVHSQRAAYAHAVLRAAVAAAQDERDEMQVYLMHARTLAESLRLAREAYTWPLPIDLVEGELWLEVDRFVEAREAFARVAGAALAARAALGLGRSLERLDDVPGACAAYRRAADANLAPAASERARVAIVRLACGAR